MSDSRITRYLITAIFAVFIVFAAVSSMSNDHMVTTSMIMNDNEKVAEKEHAVTSPFQTYEIFVPTRTETIKVSVYDPKEAQQRGRALSPWRGAIYYGIQKETYYNLPMNGVISIAHRRGIEGEYWVNEYGCKMLGDYIMIAANWSVHPYGSLVPTSLGMGIVVDTGEFAADNPYQIDMATVW